MKRINPNLKLDGHRLRDALEAIYNTVAAVLRGKRVAEERKLFEVEIPNIVFDVAVAAGWFEVGLAADSPIQDADWSPSPQVLAAINTRLDEMGAKRTPEKQKVTTAKLDSNHVLLGDYVVQRVYADSFLVLLNDVIAFNLAPGTPFEECVKQLPAKTSPDERKELLSQYIDEQHRKGYGISMSQVAQRAKVDYSVLTKWKNGRLADSALPSQRIAVLLRFDLRTNKRRYYKSYR